MGLLNRESFIKGLDDPHLSKEKCIICHGGDMYFVDAFPSLDGLEYVCNTCNPEVVIQLSDTVLSSGLPLLAKSESAREVLANAVRESREKEFKITSSRLKGIL